MNQLATKVMQNEIERRKGTPKLSAGDVRVIRSCGLSLEKISEMLNISVSYARHIRNRTKRADVR